MSYFIPFFQEEELLDQDLCGQASLEIMFHHRRLVRCLTFPKNHLRRAINICQKDLEAGTFCLLTERQTFFAIWREESSERQKVDVEVTPELPPQLGKSQISHAKEKEISSQIAGFEMVYSSSSPTTDEKDLATIFQALETTVEPIEITSQAPATTHTPAQADSSSKKSKFKIRTSDIYSTPRSAFLALFNQELAQHIGPMADYLINKLLAEQPNIQPQQMIKAIVAEIPDPEASQNIQQSLDRLTYEFVEMV